MIPLALGAQVDQAEASLREMLSPYDTYTRHLRHPASGQAAALVAVDVLAALSEAWEESVERRLDVVTARLLAWQRISGDA